MATKLRAPTWKRYFYSYRPVKWTGPFIFVVCATRLLKDRQYGSCLIKFQETSEITVSFTTILRLILLLEERFQISIL